MRNIRYIVNAQNFKRDPLHFIIDSIVAIVINLIIPIPIVGDLVIHFRGPVLWFLGTLVALFLFVIITTGIVVMTPSIISSGFFGSLFPTAMPNPTNLPEAGFVQSDTPSKSPLGGTSLNYMTITAGFMDPGYLIKFGTNHTGVDFVPTNSYFKESTIYQETKKVIVFATHTGKATAYTDKNGGKTVEVLNNKKDLKTIYIHFKETYVATGDIIKAGTPLGEMGSTGKSTGEHVHYEVRIKDGNTWRTVNPLTYIK